MANKKQILEYSDILRRAKIAYNDGDYITAIELYEQSNKHQCASLIERRNIDKFIAQIKEEKISVKT